MSRGGRERARGEDVPPERDPAVQVAAKGRSGASGRVRDPRRTGNSLEFPPSRSEADRGARRGAAGRLPGAGWVRACGEGITPPGAASTAGASPAGRARRRPYAALGGGLWPAGRAGGARRAPARAGSGEEGDGGAEEEEDDDHPVLLSEVQVVGANGEEVREAAREAVRSRANFSYRWRDVASDVRRLFGTGLFSSVEPEAEDTRDGVRVGVAVVPNPVVRSVRVVGARRLPEAAVRTAAASLTDRPLNHATLQEAALKLDDWYEAEGGLSAHLTGASFDPATGALTLEAAETAVRRVRVAFSTRAAGGEEILSPVGKTRPHVLTRRLKVAPGEVLSRDELRADARALAATGLLADVGVRVLPVPERGEGAGEGSAGPLAEGERGGGGSAGDAAAAGGGRDGSHGDGGGGGGKEPLAKTPWSADPPAQADVLFVVREARSGSLGAGGGLSTASDGSAGLVGQLTASHNNLFGTGQSVTAAANLGLSDSSYRLQHTDPWVGSTRGRVTSRTVLLQRDRIPIPHARAGGTRGGAPRPAAPEAARAAPPAAGPSLGDRLRGRAWDVTRSMSRLGNERGAGGGGAGAPTEPPAADAAAAPAAMATAAAAPAVAGTAAPAPAPTAPSADAVAAADAARPSEAAPTVAAPASTGSGSASDPRLAVVVERTSGSVEWTRQLGAALTGTLSLGASRCRCTDGAGRPLSRDADGLPLTRSRDGAADSAATVTAGANYAPPGSERALVLQASRAEAVRPGWLRYSRVTARGSDLLPLFGPLSLWLSASGGIHAGDLPPYEAFPVGGTNSVRGYAEGGVGVGSRFVTGAAEVRFPLLAGIGGTLFLDAGTDLGSGLTGRGDDAGADGGDAGRPAASPAPSLRPFSRAAPAALTAALPGAARRPGRGYGLGLGVRIPTPLGPLRLEYAWNDQLQPRFHIGVSETQAG